MIATVDDVTTETLELSLDRLVSWVRTHRYLGYEPADGNASILFGLTCGQVLPMRVLQQIVLRAPVNIRPLIGVSRHESAIGRGYMAWGYLRRYRRQPSDQVRDEAIRCLDWLIVNRAPRYDEFCWGDPYDYATRSGRRPRGEPLLIWSALIGQVFIEAYEVLCDAAYLRIAESICKWVIGLPAEKTDSGDCLSYVAYKQSSIHNANMMGAAFLARLGALTANDWALSVAKKAIRYTCNRQQRNGSWFYAEEAKYHWIDNFHTGYNLSALHTYQRATHDTTFDRCLVGGLRFYTDHLFEPDGRPKYFDSRTYPIDIQCASQAIETLATLSTVAPECLERAIAVALWTIRHMQDNDGHFYYRDLGYVKVRTPMLHWGQATMVKALETLIDHLNSGGRVAVP